MVEYDRTVTELAVWFILISLLSSDLVVDQHATILDTSIDRMVYRLYNGIRNLTSEG